MQAQLQIQIQAQIRAQQQLQHGESLPGAVAGVGVPHSHYPPQPHQFAPLGYDLSNAASRPQRMGYDPSTVFPSPMVHGRPGANLPPTQHPPMPHGQLQLPISSISSPFPAHAPADFGPGSPPPPPPPPLPPQEDGGVSSWKQ